MKVRRQMARKLNILMGRRMTKFQLRRFSQDRFPPGGAHDEGSDNVSRDLDQGDQRRVHMGTSGQVELLLSLTFHFDFSVLTSMPKMVP